MSCCTSSGRSKTTKEQFLIQIEWCHRRVINHAPRQRFPWSGWTLRFVGRCLRREPGMRLQEPVVLKTTRPIEPTSLRAWWGFRWCPDVLYDHASAWRLAAFVVAHLAGGNKLKPFTTGECLEPGDQLASRNASTSSLQATFLGSSGIASTHVPDQPRRCFWWPREVPISKHSWMAPQNAWH